MIIQPLFITPIRQSVSAHYARSRLPEVSTSEKAHRLRFKQVAQIKPVLNPRHSVAIIGRRRSCFCAFPITHTSPDSRSEVFDIEPHQLGKTQTRAVHHFQHCPDRAQRGSLISISSSRFISSTSMFFGRRGAFGAETPFAGLALSSFTADQPVKSYVAQKAVTPNLQLPALYGDCVRNCAPSSHHIAASLRRPFFAGKIDDRLEADAGS